MAVTTILKSSRTPRRGATVQLTIGAAVLLAVAIPVGGVYAFWSSRKAMQAAWAIVGPPCPGAIHSWREIARYRQPRHFKYGGVTFGHLFGAADCASVPHGSAFSQQPDYVCQFTEPVLLTIDIAGGRSFVYEPGWRRRATVALRGGRLSCVLGGWFTDEG